MYDFGGRKKMKKVFRVEIISHVYVCACFHHTVICEI